MRLIYLAGISYVGRIQRKGACKCEHAHIDGKWKLLIIRNLRVRPWRFNELRRDLEGISQKVLTDSLWHMEDDGLVFRHDYGENPPRVEYGLTELGRQMIPVMDSLADFGAYYKTIAS